MEWARLDAVLSGVGTVVCRLLPFLTSIDRASPNDQTYVSSSYPCCYNSALRFFFFKKSNILRLQSSSRLVVQHVRSSLIRIDLYFFSYCFYDVLSL